jgi:hypothetical protein
MAQDDVYRSIVVFDNLDSGEELSFHLDGRQPALLAPTMAAIGDDVKVWWDSGHSGATAEKTWHDSQLQLKRVTLRRIKPLEPIEQVYTTGLPLAGIATSDNIPAQNAALVNVRTANIGRSYRGRMYLPPVAEGFVDNGKLSVTLAPLMRTAFVNLLSALDVDDFRPCVFSKKLNLSTDIVISSTRVDRVLRTQRRRADETAVYV